jgi:hypothetical protein
MALVIGMLSLHQTIPGCVDLHTYLISSIILSITFQTGCLQARSCMQHLDMADVFQPNLVLLTLFDSVSGCILEDRWE